jgi:hypothetical protein
MRKSGGIRTHSKRFAIFNPLNRLAQRLECVRIPPLSAFREGNQEQ